jgi:uncharacterized protein (DUF433 family)
MLVEHMGRKPVDMSVLERIRVDPAICSGKPCVRGIRIRVRDVIGYLAAGMSEDQILRDFTQLTRYDILACLPYAAERERGTRIPAGL